jgi:hypothetical protein
VDRIRYGQVLAGKPILGRRPTTLREDPVQAVAEQTVAEIPAAFRKSGRRAQEAELAACEADILGRAGSLDRINDIGDLFARVTPAPGVMERGRFHETWDEHRRDRAGRKQKKRANAGDRKVINHLRTAGFDRAFGRGTCITCMTPCDTVFAPSFDCAEGHIAFLMHMGFQEEGAYFVFRQGWNEAHPVFRIDNGKMPEDWVIAGIQIPTRVCQDCFDNFQKIAWGAKHLRLKDHPLPCTDQSGGKLFGYAYEFNYCEDGPFVYERNKAAAEAAMRLEAAAIEARETGESTTINGDDIALLKSVGYQFLP